MFYRNETVRQFEFPLFFKYDGSLLFEAIQSPLVIKALLILLLSDAAAYPTWTSSVVKEISLLR